MKKKHWGLRIDSETHKKLKSLAEFDERFVNGEILYLIRQAILQHEQMHGNMYSFVSCCHSAYFSGICIYYLRKIRMFLCFSLDDT